MQKDNEKYLEVLGYEPSSYQKEIFDFVLHGTGNAVIKARAGSGKTATIISAMKLVPEAKTCLFLAFNKAIAEEITAKLKGKENCSVMTVHSLGYRIILKNRTTKPGVNDKKYSTYLKKNITELSTAKISTKAEVEEYIDSILSLLDFSRLNLAQSKKEIDKIAVKYDIPVRYDESEVVMKLMEWGKNSLMEVDYVDMVWLPTELDMNVKYFRYNWIFNDEAQDYSVAYVKLFMKCFKRGTRFISVCDDFQAINFFAGASEMALDSMINHPNTKMFTLPISYRCDRNIIKAANNLVPDILARPNADDGIVIENGHLNEIRGNDMVLCRNNAPLFKLYIKLIDKNIPCYIKGKDNDKKKLINTIERFAVGEELGKDLNVDGLFPRLYDNMVEERNRLIAGGLDPIDAIDTETVQSKYDTIVSLDAIAKKCRTKSELISRIDKIYSVTETGVCLSTVHKAKGLEADNVHIICRSLMPSKSAKTKYEIQQETNLMYVAITRARHKLFYTSEVEFPVPRAVGNDGDMITEFKYIETKVCRLYHKQPVNYMTDGEMARFRLNDATVIEPFHKNDNAKTVQASKPKLKSKKKSLLDNLK